MPPAATRSLMTTRAPSRASFRAISRPMPRPEPETRATLPSRVRVMGVPWWVSVPGDQRFAAQLGEAVLVGRGQLQLHAAVSVVLELLGDLRRAGDALAHVRDGGKAHG